MKRPGAHTDIPIAIIGMACRLPGADNLDQFWKLLARGGSAVAELPPDRLDQQMYYDPRRGQRNKTYSKLGAVLSSRQFDRQACPMPLALERGVDIAHLLMCEVAAAACRHASLDPFRLPLRNTGVYIGHAQGSTLAGDFIYGTCIEEAAHFLGDVNGFKQLPPEDQHAVIHELVKTVRSQMPQRSTDSPDVATNMVAGTISKAFELSGPFMAINSACASSLQSVLLAARALQLGRVDMAIAGGASDCKSDSLVLFSHAQSMSETGTRPFDADADGLICGEGYVALVLKTLPRALADGDPIQAVIRGLGVSSDGRGKSLWAPRREGQVMAMERAYGNDLDMASLQYLEAHATSTSLGDATELNALAEVLGGAFAPGKQIPISSVKANIGHTLEAAGISGVIKTVLCMQHRTFVPAINIGTLNPKIDWDSAPFYIPRQLTAWPEQADALPRRAAVNAFGIGGLNMHLVLEEFSEERREALATKYSRAPHNAAPSSGPAAANADDKSTAVIGMGCILPGASTPGKFWELILTGRDPKGPTPPDRWRADLAYEPGSRRAYRTPTTLGGYITDFAYDWRAHKLPPKQVQQADPLQFMLLEAADQALKDSGYDKREFDRTRVGVLVGTEFGGDFSTQLGVDLRLPEIAVIVQQSLARHGVSAQDAAKITTEFGEVLLEHWPALIDETGSFSTSTLASRITKTMNLMGGAAAIDASDASSAAVLATSVDLLLSGDCDMMIAAGGQRCMNLPQYEGYALAGVLATGNRVRAPFDANANGIVPGEGVGVVLLKRLADARRDGDRIHAIIRGIGAAHAPSVAGSLQLAIDRAFQNSGVDPADVALVEMDGTAQPDCDRQQLAAVLDMFGHRDRKQPLMIGSVTGQIGHTAGASAMASLIKASFEIETGQMPPCFGVDTPLSIVRENAGAIQITARPARIRHASRDGRRFGAVSSSSKNQAYHIVLERGEKVATTEIPGVVAAHSNEPPRDVERAATPALAGDSRIFRLGATTSEELAAKLQRVLSDGSAALAAAGQSPFIPTDQARLAIVGGSDDAMLRKLEMAARQFTNPDAQPVLEQQGCFYRQVVAEKPRIAMLFPGQGSQYCGMLQELAREVPAAADMIRKIDAVMLARGYQTFANMAWENPTQLGSDIWVTQIAMLIADLVVHAAIAEMGIRPDLVAGHSYGEYAALTTAGVWDLEAVVTAARARYEAIKSTPMARGRLMATTASGHLVERLAATLSERAWIANHNAPDQIVVGGRGETLDQLAELLAAAGHTSQVLAVPCAYHTPLMEGAGTMLKPTLYAMRLRPPRAPFLSSVTNRYTAEPDEIRSNLVAQLTSPVRYVDLIRRIADEQSTVFIEVGPQQALTKLHRRILEGRPHAGILACDNPKHPGVQQLLHVRAVLECLGVLGDQANIGPHSIPTTSPQGEINQPQKGSITHIDATQRRLEKMRHMAAGAGQKSNGQGVATAPEPPASAPRSVPLSQTQESVAPARHGGAAAKPIPLAAASAPRMAAPAARSVPVTSIPPAAPSAATRTDNLDPAQLERFLINFVVEQTGYPPEVVELDADLEADLGIDSIKKAQLFGELAEYFDVQATDNLTLDDFPTLRHVTNFLAGAWMKRGMTEVLSSAGTAPQRAPSTPVAAPVEAPQTSAAATLGWVRTMQPSAAPVVQATSAAGCLDPAQLEKFLINFVVEQTGYPPDVVELDADLEADLGIDSIKKAQLFGELDEYFDVQATDSLTLDDFPTLRHVTNFLAGARMKGEPAMNLTASAAPAPVAAASSPTPLPATAALAMAPMPAAAAVQVAPPSAAMAPQAAVGGGLNPAELEQFLINFVVEQTGYPPEVVELDADLEADLGIDSIKKAQLFGELAEYFDVQATGNLTLDDFPTLRHVTNFLAGSGLKKNLISNPADPPDHASTALSDATAPHESQNGDSPYGEGHTFRSATPSVTLNERATGDTGSDFLRLSGTPYEMGFEHGRHKRNAILRVLRCYADLAGLDDSEPLFDIAAGDDPASRFSADELDEMRGIADAAQVPLSNLLVHNLTIVSGAGPSASRALADCLELVVQVRTPAIGVPHVLVSVAGGASDLCDVNTGRLANDALQQVNGPTAVSPRRNVHPSIAAQVLARADATLALDRLRDLVPRCKASPPTNGEAPAVALPEYDLPYDADDQTHRFFMRELTCPLDPGVGPMPEWKGAALIVGKNPLGDALVNLLKSAGVVVRELVIGDDLDQTLDAFERIWSEQPTPHVFIVTPRDTPAIDPLDAESWERRWHRVAVAPYFLCQRFVQLASAANLLDRATLVAAVSLNGSFGFTGDVAAPECGALTGLMKAIYLEVGYLGNHRKLRVKAVDAPVGESPQSLAANICRELASKEVDYEVAFAGGVRRVQCAYPQPAPVEHYAEVRPGGTWVITGGCRGITAQCALELGQRFGLKLHLLGTSPLPQIDPRWRTLTAEEKKSLKIKVMREARSAGRQVDAEWIRVQKDIEIDRSLRAFAAAGVNATYHPCDVADCGALAGVLDKIRRDCGPIEGIVHGAGIERAASYERKSRDTVLATLAVKIDGALNLMRLTMCEPVRHFIGFGSVSGRLGSNGQTDYCLANDALAKLAAWYRSRRPGVRAVTFHWHPWNEVGMAATPESLAMRRVSDGPPGMPLREGIAHFVRELYAHAPAAEVLITSWEYHGRFYGTEHHPKSLARPAGVQAAEPAVEAWEKLPFDLIASRHELKLVDAPLPPGGPNDVAWQGPAWILGDNPTARALGERLQSAGVAVDWLPESTATDDVMATVESLYTTAPPRYLFLMSGRDELDRPLLDRDIWQERRARGVTVPFLAAQHWLRLRAKAKDRTPITVLAATSLGGDFGLSHNVTLPDGGAMTGMLKSIYIEDSRVSPSEVRVKVVDAPGSESPEAVVDAIVRELAADDPHVEVGWAGGRRSVIRLGARPVETLPRQTIARGGLWVATGGARGITAAAAFELASRFGIKFHLIGRSPTPRNDAFWRGCTSEQLAEIKAQVVRQAVFEGRSPEQDWDRIKYDIEIHDTLGRFKKAGLEATYHSCDVADWDQLAATLDKVRQDGPIEGILHGAGYGKSGRFDKCSLELLERTLNGKLDGAVALMSLTQHDPIKHMIGFGSIAGRYGGNGLTAYAAANDMFAKLAAWYRARRPDCGVCCLDWQSWDDVGMALHGESAAGTKGVLKMAFIPAREGVEHVCREFEAGLPTTEVVITDRFFERMFYPFLAALDAAAPSTAAPADVDRGPLVETVRPLHGEPGSEAEIHFNPAVDPFLLDHQFRGKPLLPAVIGLEAIAETARLAVDRELVAISDVELIDGLVFHTDRILAARVRAIPDSAGKTRVELVSDFRNRTDKLIQKDRLHLRAVVELADRAMPFAAQMPEPPTDWYSFAFQTSGLLVHGPTLQGVKATTFDARRGWGQLVALSLQRLGGARTGRWIVPATLLDAGFYVCGIHAWFNAAQAFSLPSSIEQIRFGRTARENEHCLLTFECREIGPQQAIYDFTIFGDDRAAILHVQGHRIVMVKP